MGIKKKSPDSCLAASGSGDKLKEKHKNNIAQLIENDNGLSSCPNSPGVFHGISLVQNQIQKVSSPMRCNSWACPYCAPKKLKSLRARAYNGDLFEFVSVENPYVVKMLTLTFPGVELRQFLLFGNDLQQATEIAYEMMSKAWNKLRTYLKRKYPKMHFFRLWERQNDGYPHIHALFTGDDVISKAFYLDARKWWEHNCKMGFCWVSRAKKFFKGYVHAVRYITKYMLKGIEPIKKHSRVFSSSRRALAPPIKKNITWLEYKIRIGQIQEKRESRNIDIVDIGKEITSIEDSFEMYLKLHDSMKFL
jgi:hypothetical protein